MSYIALFPLSRDCRINFAGGKCAFCHFTYITNSEYKEHLSCHSEAVKCKYEGCKYISTNKNNLNSHIMARHEQKTDQMIPCDKCGKSFDSLIIERHIRKTHGDLEGQFQYHCGYCNLSFP